MGKEGWKRGPMGKEEDKIIDKIDKELTGGLKSSEKPSLVRVSEKVVRREKGKKNKFETVRFDKSMTGEDMIKKLDQRGLRPATEEELEANLPEDLRYGEESRVILPKIPKI